MPFQNGSNAIQNVYLTLKSHSKAKPPPSAAAAAVELRDFTKRASKRPMDGPCLEIEYSPL